VILDTSVLIAAERGPLALEELTARGDDGAVAAITVAEMWMGVELADDRRRPARVQFMERVFALTNVEVYDLTVARAHARLLAETKRSGRPAGAHDLIVAATAVARDRIVVTLDARGFSSLPGVDVRAPA
jgi:tRNA(fMet)-specific endonuclease VapC